MNQNSKILQPKKEEEEEQKPKPNTTICLRGQINKQMTGNTRKTNKFESITKINSATIKFFLQKIITNKNTEMELILTYELFLVGQFFFLAMESHLLEYCPWLGRPILHEEFKENKIVEGRFPMAKTVQQNKL